AAQIENRLSKEEILALYLALAPYGGNLEGTPAASLAYFGKEPRHLSTAEAAMLVALPQAPETRRPDRFPLAAQAARDRVLTLLMGQGIINPDQVEAAEIEPAPKERKLFPIFVAHVAERLVKQDRDAKKTNVVETTTISRSLQEQLENPARERATVLGGGV